MGIGRPKTEGPTWVKVEEAIGASRTTLTAWRRLPGAPQKPDVDQWLAFYKDHGLGKGSSRQLVDLKILIAEEQLKKAKRDNAVAEAEVIDRKVISDFLADLAAKLDAVITHEFIANAAPKLVGMDIGEVRRCLAEARERVRHATRNNLLKWSVSNE
jgi:hypothetical protein